MLKILGIRHHGPGSARSLCVELGKLRPDVILVEGPPDADDLIPLAAGADMIPPIALLIYQPDKPQNAVYYPFAEFSPEWQALQYGLKNSIPVRFMDLPQAYQIGETRDEIQPGVDGSEPFDAFSMIAEAAGYSDGERWWEHFVEQRQDSGEVFQGILELMRDLRLEAEKAPAPVFGNDLVREAFMRTTIRAAQVEGYQNIAVVCGAWHSPALAELDKYEEDAKLLKGLSKKEVASTWVPWTYNRLSRRSGYGAGIDSPGWYEHLWQVQTHIVEKWMVRVAQLMREEDLGISPAHAIEATRLAETLAALRERSLPGLSEVEESVRAIFCFGDDTPMRLIHEKLIVGQRMGKIPDSAPSVPLQRDLVAVQKRTRLEPSASPESIDLDLRKPLLLERSQLLHRLNLLGIPWGKLQTVHGAKGTFHEVWQIEWKPEFAVAVIEASIWGNTVLEAAGNKVNAEAAQTTELPVLTRLVEAALLADLSEPVLSLMKRLQDVAATSGDISHLMEALPPLANILRYGNVRQTDTSMVKRVVDELVARMCIGLPPACSSLDDNAAQVMFEHIQAVQKAIEILQDEAHAAAWKDVWTKLANQDGVHGLIRGEVCRLLYDQTGADKQTAVYMSQALSPGTPADQAAAWVQGFLNNSGQALIHHPRLRQLVDEWILSLPEALFTDILPILRRTFSTFSSPERRQIGEMAKYGGRVLSAGGNVELDADRVEKALSLVRFILES
ncbi:MAG: hypothetical protein EHM41_05425 [Chloroflexi bacterium]|nr:MAG: hypothetical protein EHM41_05425 [Chloroflexota bacterium]